MRHFCTLFLLQHSWQQYIYVKCHNINREPGGSKHDDDDTVPSSKRRIVANQNKHLYPSVDAEFDDDTSHDRNKLQLGKELDRAKPPKDRLVELMKRTYGRRRGWILEGAVSVKEIIREYILLKRSAFVSHSKVLCDKHYFHLFSYR